MMHLILTGATGLVGSSVLDAMLKMQTITKISILSRRPVKMAEDSKDSRINVIIHNDFTTYPEGVLAQLKGASGCVWALGTAQYQVSKQDYITITKSYALAAATAFSNSLAAQCNTPPFRFVYVAGGDTTTSPRRFTSFQARIKGETELALAEICNASNGQMTGCSVRPFYVDMSRHDAIKPYVAPRILAHRVSEAVLGTPIRTLTKNYWAPTEQLGSFLSELATGQHVDKVRDDKNLDLGGFQIWTNASTRKVKGY